MNHQQEPLNRHFQRGTATVEQVVLLLTVAVGFGAAVMGLGPVLLAYHEAIVFVLSLPVP